MSNDTHVCSKCNTTQPQGNFPSSGRQCKACVREVARLRRLDKKLEAIQNDDAWYLAPKKQKPLTEDQRLQKTYGISLAEKQAMIADQLNKCGICRTDITGPTSSVALDHCHTTGKVRGVLCNPCNMMLGLARDDIKTLQNAILYLLQHKEV